MIKIVSFNLRCQWMGDGVNAFVHRVGFIYDKIRNEQPDVIAFQEMKEKFLELLKKMFPEYAFYGSMRTASYDGEGLYIAVRKETVSMLSTDVFWLSPTPYVAGSRFEKQSTCPRVCVATKLRNLQTNEVFRVIDVPLDHISDEARILGMRCLLSYVEESNARDLLPTVILGDFNATPNSETIREMNAQSAFFEATKCVETTTFHNFGKLDDCKIDYIYVSKEWQNKKISVSLWQDEHEGIYLSDHYPLCATIE